MQQLLKSQERGAGNSGWLASRHSFSFGHWHNPDRTGFRSLRVINEDEVAPGAGFEEHGHRDMEIITWVLDGALEHRDSLGHAAVIRPGEIQSMSAGTGIRHSEMNHSRTEPVHFLQIWILPEHRGLAPGYEQYAVPVEDRRGRFALIGARKGDGAKVVTIHQDVRLYTGLFEAGEADSIAIAPGRGAYVHVARGRVEVNGAVLGTGDALALEDVGEVTVRGIEAGEVLLFNLA